MKNYIVGKRRMVAAVDLQEFAENKRVLCIQATDSEKNVRKIEMNCLGRIFVTLNDSNIYTGVSMSRASYLFNKG